MKKNLFFIFLFLSILIISQSTFSQWVRVNGPQGGIFNAVYVKNQIFYAGAYNGDFYSSTNNCQSWVLNCSIGRYDDPVIFSFGQRR